MIDAFNNFICFRFLPSVDHRAAIYIFFLLFNLHLDDDHLIAGSLIVRLVSPPASFPDILPSLMFKRDHQLIDLIGHGIQDQ